MRLGSVRQALGRLVMVAAMAAVGLAALATANAAPAVSGALAVSGAQADALITKVGIPK